MMKAIRVAGYNAAPTLEDISTPEVSADQVLVRITAASLNPLDVKLHRGELEDFFPMTFPYTVGTDLAGTIERTGEGVTGWAVGDQVVARVDPTSGGALAEFAIVPASYLVRVPPSIPLAEVAGIGTAGATAWQALFEVADLQKGQTILIHAGAGGVGSFAIQFARGAGARVIATASGDGIAIARRLGADQVIDYKAERLADKVSSVDVVLDTIGGETQQSSFDLLRAGGHLISIVSPPDEALAKAHGVTGTFFPHMSDADRLAKVVASIAAGTRILIDQTLPLAAFDDAFRRQASGRARGKIIVMM